MNISIPLITLVTNLTPIHASIPEQSNIVQSQLLSKEELVQIVSEKQKMNIQLDEFTLVLPTPSLYSDTDMKVAKQQSIEKRQTNEATRSVIKNTEE